MNALACAFQNGVLPGTPGRTTVKLSRRACSFRAAQSGAARAAPWMVAATAQTNSNRSSPDCAMLDILVHPFMFGIFPLYLKLRICLLYHIPPQRRCILRSCYFALYETHMMTCAQ